MHGFIFLSDLEKALIDSRPMQRLKHIRQLALTYLVYPGATHSRFEHSLGTMALAGQAFDALVRNSPDVMNSIFKSDDELRRWKAIVRVGGLLHDIGHAPFSHAGDGLFAEDVGSHEEMTRRLALSDEISEVLRNHGSYRIDSADIAYVASGIGVPTSVQALVAKELITGDLGVDRMDYLQRDSRMCGVNYGLFDLPRLVSTLMLVRGDDGQPVLALEHGGMHAAEGLLTARYFMFSQVYFHDVRDVYDAHLHRFLRGALAGGEHPTNIEEYLSWDDVGAYTLLRSNQGNRDAQAITNRKHFRTVYQFSTTELAADPTVVDRIREQAVGEFGGSVLVRDSRKQTVSIKPGDIRVVDVDGNRSWDILDQSTTLAGLRPIWLARVFCDTDIRTSVLAYLFEHLGKQEDTDG